MTGNRVRPLLAGLALLLLSATACQPADQPTGPPAGSASAAPTASTSPPPPAVSSPLPFDLPPPATLRASKKMVFAHYFTPYPLSLDNKPAAEDYYTRNYLDPDGENGKFKAEGGLLRQRPLPRDPRTGDWQLADLETEVRRASAAGLDGFTVDLLALSGRNWDAVKNLVTAAETVDPGFKIVLMPDMTALGGDQAALTTAVKTLAASKSVYRLADGRVVVSPFAAERQPVAWWTQWMASAGLPIALVPCFVDPSRAAAFEPISYGLSEWGARSPAGNAGAARRGDFAHSKGKIWMQPVAPQDVRPRSAVYDEANNTENYRTTWQGAIAGADWVQIPTWNDYSEGTEISPSTHTGWTFLDLTSYYLTWFKTGSPPPLRRDVAYLTHRVQPAAAKPTAQTKVMTLRPYGSRARDAVEVLTVLTAPATVRLSIGGRVEEYTAPAGLSARTFPLATGANAVILVRDGVTLGQVTSPFPVRASVAIQDLQYYAVSTAPR